MSESVIYTGLGPSGNDAEQADIRNLSVLFDTFEIGPLRSNGANVDVMWAGSMHDSDRSTLYLDTDCRSIWSNEETAQKLEEYLAKFNFDPAVMDLLLNSLHAAASTPFSSNTRLLLPECPLSNEEIINVANELPALATTVATTPPAAYSTLGVESEILLSWLCTNCRGYLTPVTDTLRIPNMPTAHQFVLANPSQAKEKAFAAHLTGPDSSRVVFHGTSLERLYGILYSGLIITSGTVLQRHGAAFGRGIYTVTEPRSARPYAAVGSGRRSSQFINMRIILGCELATSVHAVAEGIYVVPDETQLMVRYVFLLDSSLDTPLAKDVAPAMMIAFDKLRGGLV